MGMAELGGGEAPADRPAGRGWGGRRAGAGRPPGRSGGPTGDDAIYAKGFLGDAMHDARDLLAATLRDESRPIEVRTCCALGLLTGNRYLGGRRRRDPGSGGNLGQAEAGGNPIDPVEGGEPDPTRSTPLENLIMGQDHVG
jgi:hypothetical protein